MLHLIFQSPLDIAILDRIAEGDVAVFMESASLCVLKQGRFADILAAKLNTCHLCVISEDIQVRGILVDEMVAGIVTIDYAELVNLSIANKQCLTWS